jgi:drug/metabolite transporter (DMT)-like permease
VIATLGAAVALFTGLGSAPSRAWRGDVLMVAAALCMALHPQRRRRRRPDGVTNQNVRLMRLNQVTNLSGAHSTHCRSNKPLA